MAPTTEPIEDPDRWQFGTASQRARAKRSLQQLRTRQVPVFQGPLLLGPDENEVEIRSVDEIASRLLIFGLSYNAQKACHRMRPGNGWRDTISGPV